MNLIDFPIFKTRLQGRQKILMMVRRILSDCRILPQEIISHWSQRVRRWVFWEQAIDIARMRCRRCPHFPLRFDLILPRFSLRFCLTLDVKNVLGLREIRFNHILSHSTLISHFYFICRSDLNVAHRELAKSTLDVWILMIANPSAVCIESRVMMLKRLRLSRAILLTRLRLVWEEPTGKETQLWFVHFHPSCLHFRSSSPWYDFSTVFRLDLGLGYLLTFR